MREWDPEDGEFWDRSGKLIARRNLVVSIVTEHVGFSIWSIWSVLVLFLSPEIGFDFTAGEKFLLVLVPTLVGAVLRLPYSYAVIRWGGRTWTVFSTAILLVPTLLAWYFVQQPGTPMWVFVLIGALTGLGGGCFASSMTNVAHLYPRRHQGWALGLNAGGGNIGVAVVHVVGLLVIATVGDTHPAYVAGIYLPVIVLATVLAALFMDNVDPVDRSAGGRGALREALAYRHTWLISALYVGTFGSFIGYSFAFGLVLQHQLGATAFEAASYTFLGPLLGSLARPVGGRLADRLGGAVVTSWVFLGMAASVALLVLVTPLDSLGLFVTGFVLLFVLSGLGNGSTYKMIPTAFADQVGTPRHGAVAARVRRLTGATVAIAGAIGALGGVLINLAFRASFDGAGSSGVAAFAGFLAYYLLCLLILHRGYLRTTEVRAEQASRSQREGVRV
ncbi:nitrate/nitrite transporter [Haloechinothrix sp. LS1_15]|uniref:nitrate/nitrite transporter n=1 Tax=Haloechinothrix sp. LS1_15 TaxID=2652248 RepID=UPI00294AE1AC|nr:nitrate/nitrite transporter [Haloechinothrix sp. LS1_15]